MGKEYLFFYIESMVVCIIIFSILLIHDLVMGDRQEKKFRFDNVLLSHILYFAVDGVWAAMIAGAIPRTTFRVLFVNYALLFLLALVGCCWFFFTAALMSMPRRGTKRGKRMIYAPMLIMCVITLVGMLLRPSAFVTGDYTLTLLYYFCFMLAPLIYIVSSFIYSIYQATRKENLLHRKLYLITGAYPLTVVLAGLFQIVYANAPIFCYACTIMIILFNLLSMEDQISLDPLTNLNNRGQLMRHAAQESALHKEGLKTYVAIADVNNFKMINDTYGHAEGDHALIMIADALRHAAERAEIPPFLARYGGDEFVLIAHITPESEGETVMQQMIDGIHSDLKAMCEKEHKPYIITLGFGFEQVGHSDSFLDCMQRADKKLYDNKMKMKLSQEAEE